MTSQLVVNVTGRLPQYGEFAPGAPPEASPQGHTGDCVLYAFMVARASAIPSAVCNGVELDRLTNEAIAAGQAGAQGEMTDANLLWLCDHEDIPAIQITTGDLISMARMWAGGMPLLMGFANGQALPGNEPNVHGHCVAVLDWNGSAFTVANGDSAQGRIGHFDVVTPSELAAAQPTQLTRLELDTMAIVQPSWDSATGTLTYPAHDGLAAITLDHGQAWYAHNNRVGVYPLLPAYYAGDDSVVVWSDCQKSVAVKAQNWAIHLESAAADIVSNWTHGVSKPIIKLTVNGQAVGNPANITIGASYE